MLSPLRNRFGIPGVISVIALVFAMFGGAYAASNSGDDSKASDKATASAKAKRGPRGPKGPAGPAGAQGPAGPAGAKGDKGDNGSNGSNGQGAQVTSFTGSKGPIGGVTCTAGGLEVKSASGTTLVCNGKAGSAGAPGAQGPPGSPWTLGGTLPSGETLKGAWSLGQSGKTQKYVATSISFLLELPAEPPTVVYVGFSGSETVISGEKEGEVTDRCPSSNPLQPDAAPGYLCFYESINLGKVPVFAPEFIELNSTKAGVTLWTEASEVPPQPEDPPTGEYFPIFLLGNWAVTAP